MNLKNETAEAILARIKDLAENAPAGNVRELAEAYSLVVAANRGAGVPDEDRKRRTAMAI
ncbi:hypothetical protein [Gordonia alkaliphila]|uniref:Uncharacterized protein n=1 Tax=Gordonia alkaliphila TaxID=1053547 RepID=A0ABP8ZE51_9ACTN